MFPAGSVRLSTHEAEVWSLDEASLSLNNFEDDTKAFAKVRVTITTDRIVFSPLSDITYHVASKGDRVLPVISIPLYSIQESRLVQPWFGPYKYELLSASVPELEPQAVWRLTLSFTSGGVFDFHSNFGSARASAVQARLDGIPEPLPAYEP